jgi:hypothetical protein
MGKILKHQTANHHTKKQVITSNFFLRAKVSDFFWSQVFGTYFHTPKSSLTPQKQVNKPK